MKKLLTIIILTLLSCNISYAKDNSLKIFKKEILGADAKKKMGLAYNSLKKHKNILSFDKKDKAINIMLDTKMKGHKEDWDISDSKNQRWEFVTKKNKHYKNGEEFYIKYTFKLNGSTHEGSIFQVVGVKKDGEIIFPAMHLAYRAENDDRLIFSYNLINEVFWTKKDPTANRFNKTAYYFTLGELSEFEDYSTVLMKIKPSKGDDGEFIMWMNGNKVIEAYGQNMVLGEGMSLKIGLYRWLNINADIKKIVPTTLSIKEFSYGKNCEEILDKKKCDYKSNDRQSKTSLKYKKKERKGKTGGSKIIKSIKSKNSSKALNFVQIDATSGKVCKGIPFQFMKDDGTFGTKYKPIAKYLQDNELDFEPGTKAYKDFMKQFGC